MDGLRPSRRQVLRASLIGGIAVYLAPLGSRAYAALFDDRGMTPPAWNSRDSTLKYRIDGISKVTGEKVFARDIRARDMPHWPQQQGHALVLRVTKADRPYAGFDLSLLDPDLTPDRVVTAADLARDRLLFPEFYGDDMLLPQGQIPAYLGQAVAILIYKDFVRFRFAKYKLQFNNTVVRYGEPGVILERDPWGSSRFVRVAGADPAAEDVFSPVEQGSFSPTYRNHQPVWPEPARDGEVGPQGMYFANAIARELAEPPPDWLVVQRDYATQSGDTAALEPDNVNGWYDREREELHLVVASQSPQEVAENTASMLAASKIGLKRLFLHPCFTVGYGSKDHCNTPYYGLVAAIYGDGVPIRLANDRFEQFQTSLKRHQFDMHYAMAVDRKTGLMQTFQANIIANGGGRANCSV
ncbi:MAG: molybdopterin cofactor-binding domain-containing protein, partial [Xanthobacteraceae bacterium]